MGNPPSEDELLVVYTIELNLHQEERLWELVIPLGWRLVKDDEGGLSLETSQGVGREEAWQVCHELIEPLGPNVLEAYPIMEQVRPATSSERDEPGRPEALALPIALLSFGAATPRAPNAVDRRWHLEAINLPQALLGELSGLPAVRIGHLDTGHSSHPELAQVYEDARREHSARFGGGGAPEHGTHTASVLASRIHVPPSPRDIYGVAQHAKLYPVRVHKHVILAPWKMDDLARAIDEAVKAECKIISISMGGPLGRERLRQAVEDAIKEGVIVVAAAGQLLNWMDARWLPGGVTVPGSYDGVITAAACERVFDEVEQRYKLQVARWSARGPEVDIIAPGWPIAIASWEDGYEGKDDRTTIKQSWGTSYATAQTAGVAALWVAHYQDELEQIPRHEHASLFKQALKESCEAHTPEVEGWTRRDWGFGLLNAAEVLKCSPLALRAARSGGLKEVRPKGVAPSSSALDGFLDRMWTQIDAAATRPLVYGEARERLVAGLDTQQLWSGDLSSDMEAEVVDLVLRDAALQDYLVARVARAQRRPEHIAGPLLPSLMLAGVVSPADDYPMSAIVKREASPALLAALSNKT